MMFKMSHELKKYLRPLSNIGVTKIDFDTYYLCAVVGLSKLERIDAKSEPEFVKIVPNKYMVDGKYKELLLSLINAEVRRLGTNLENRHDIKSLCNIYLDTNSTNNLTEQGIDALNSYCAAGYNIIRKSNVNLSEARVFFQEYINLINNV